MSERTPESRLDQVERRLALLEAERAILARLYQYSYALDSGDKAKFMDCFTPDHVRWGGPGGRWTVGQNYRYEGLEAMEYYFDGHTHAPDLIHMHLLAEPLIRIDADRATSESYLIRVDENEDGPYVEAMAKYEDVLVRCDDGEWRIKERHVTVYGWLDRKSSAQALAEVRARNVRKVPPGTTPAM
ncbi:MAG TPA: nuclear transport factor 2 family protein [Candidatus Nitrosotalea sp.]|nr:nuclear transport factor 2 family protein [Candidatus Nitrosotalea sp.]